ncbi:hypothetical protein R1sor_017948 [Riccia sorocarpa]|uniref:Uncharacterized protein n=1 Tax=Riccia sorocarpa TaxID=122646 RepID=A0ABD3ICA6_9MARC
MDTSLPQPALVKPLQPTAKGPPEKPAFVPQQSQSSEDADTALLATLTISQQADQVGGSFVASDTIDRQLSRPNHIHTRQQEDAIQPMIIVSDPPGLPQSILPPTDQPLSKKRKSFTVSEADLAEAEAEIHAETGG